MDGFSEEEFNKNILEIFNISELISDNFALNRNAEKFFLSKKLKIALKSRADKIEADQRDEDESVAVQDQEEVYSFEYHILFHQSYSVPALYFNAYSENGRKVSIDEVSKLFVKEYERHECKDILNMISEGEHPILFKPFFYIHPCKINQVLANFPESKNRALTFISIYGPSVRLNLSSEYEKFFL